MPSIFSSTMKVDCPDGPRYILKKPERAFAINFPEWNVRVSALVKFLSGSEAKVDPKISKKTKSIVENLTENYATLQAHYQAAYLGWSTNPCSKEAEKAYNDAKSLICEKEFVLKKLEIGTSKIANKVKAKLGKKGKGKKKNGDARRKERRRTILPGPLPAKGRERIPVPMAVFDDIEELVSQLKI